MVMPASLRHRQKAVKALDDALLRFASKDVATASAEATEAYLFQTHGDNKKAYKSVVREVHFFLKRFFDLFFVVFA